MTRIITCTSGKGGAGKTTLVANLGLALRELGRDVIVVDANLTTPNLGLHLGVPLYPTTLHDVLKGTADIKDAIYRHESGLKVIPAGISLRDLRGVDAHDLPEAVMDLLGSAEIVLIDSAAGLGKEALSAIEASDEIIIVTTPDLPSVTDALKTMKLAEQVGTRVTGVVINRVTKMRHEMTTQQVSNMLDGPEILAEIPEDINVHRAVASRQPVVHHVPHSHASRSIKGLAATLVGEPSLTKDPWYKRFLSFMYR
ncbi:MAG: P-loop NTPase [Candidatus Aenigmarchaeota archaeon]|nr:P-loop NTPase [Candidatus Aenigmarchaeota archaeon]